jgi:hypothetical protein
MKAKFSSETSADSHRTSWPCVSDDATFQIQQQSSEPIRYYKVQIEEYEQEVLIRTNRLFSFDMTWATQKTTLLTILHYRGNIFTE